MIFINKEYLSLYLVIFKKLQYWSATGNKFHTAQFVCGSMERPKWLEQKVALTNNFKSSQSRWWPKKQLDHSSKWTSLQDQMLYKIRMLMRSYTLCKRAHTHGDVLYVSVEQGSIGIGEQDPGKTSKKFTKALRWVSISLCYLHAQVTTTWYLEKNRRRDQSIVGYITEFMMKMPQKCKCNMWCINLLQNPYEVPMWRIIMRQNCFKQGWFGWMWFCERECPLDKNCTAFSTAGFK